MLAVVAALGFLAALGGFGVVVLRRSGPNLTTLESVAYGAPLGTVLGTLLILLLARVIGLTAATVTVGAAALMGALSRRLFSCAGRSFGWAPLRTRTRALPATM